MSFSWTWHPHPDVWAALIVLGAGYYVAAVRSGAATPKQRALFYGGLVILWLSAEWPLHDVAERSLFSAHMVQHLLLTFVAAPLLLMGTPRRVLRMLLGRGARFRAWRLLTRPLPAFVTFNAVVLATHWPVVVEASLGSALVHAAIHYALIGAAVVTWWPVLSPLPELSTLSDPMKLLYLFLQTILPTIPASFLTFATEPIYDVYAGLPHLWGLSTVVDQQIAGLIMKLGGGLLLSGVIAVMFFRWYAREERGEVQELSWEDFEQELSVRKLRG